MFVCDFVLCQVEFINSVFDISSSYAVLLYVSCLPPSCLPVVYCGSCICCVCRVSAQNISLPPVPGLEPVALPQSSQPSLVEASSPASENRSAVYVIYTDID